ncbi:uncharacterized protein LOC143197268 isoform X4 [Rhynchophorus ferrugineus]|uniref:uncharacterized protein LOC143197268 isoform X4 n=1 Tax=Rhynchophorus ferrugineus TaxID=354439 RepID=UPI003FCE880A
MEDVNEPVVQSKVRNLVHAYENQTTYVESASEQYSFRRRSKSIGHALTYKLFRDPNLQLNSLLDIEKEVVKLDTHLNYYEYYDKETHVAFLEQLFEVFKALVSIDPEGCETTKQKKAELIAETQKLSKTLNAKLPYNSPSKRLVRRIEVAAQREDNIVTTTGNYEVLKHSISSEASNSSFNKSTESLSSLKDSSNQLKISNDNEQSTSQYNETTPDTTVQSPTEIQDQPKPKSVSKLTRFFSFRESKPSIPIIPSAYSGVSRSASTTSKTNKYIKYKEFKSQQKKVTEEHFKETEEEEQSRDVTLSGNEEIIRMNSTEEEVEKHQSQTEIEVAQGEQNTEEQKQPTVSVSKLKNFFEERKEEENEGLKFLTKNQTKFSTGSDIPYTEMNLGAFRLKRTISGNYLNFVRVLRSTDITKTVDINKSKSMPNLLDQEIKPEGYDDELDENITSQNGKESSAESINDLVFNEKKNNQQEEIGVLLSSSNQVKVLKETFEKMSSEQEVQVDPQEQQEVNAILHREITPEQVHVHGNPEVQISNFSEPALKVPIQLRLGPLINTEEVVTEGTEDTQETTAEETKEQTEEIKVEDVKEESSSTTHEKSGINMTGSILLKSTDLFKSSSLIKGIISQQAARETIVSIVTAEEETAVENPEQQNNITEHDIETNDGGLINKQVITGSETIVTTANSVEEIVVPSPEEQTNITERDVETRTKVVNQQATPGSETTTVSAVDETVTLERQNSITEHHVKTNPEEVTNQQATTGSETIVTTVSAVEETQVQTPEQPNNNAEHDVETNTIVVSQQATAGSETTTVSAVDETVTLERQNSITEHHIKTNPEEVINQQATTGSETNVTTVSAVEETQVQIPEQPNNNAEHDVETNTIEVTNQQVTTTLERTAAAASAVKQALVQTFEQQNNITEHHVETNTQETLHTQFGTEKSKEEIITEDQADIKVAQSTEESKEVTEDQVNSENEGDNIDTQIAIENTNEEKIIAQISKREQETQAADDQDVRKIDEAETIDHEVTTEETKEELIRDIPTAIQVVKEIAEIKEATEDPVIEAEIQTTVLQEISSNEVEVKNEAASIVSEQDISDTTENMVLENATTVEEISTEAPQITNFSEAIAVTVTNNIDEVVCSTIEDENIKVKEQVSEVSENKKVEVKSTNTEEINNFAETASSVEIVNEKPSSEVVEIIEVEGCDRTTGKCSVNITENIVSQDGQSYLTTEEELAGTESVSSVNIISENPSSEVVETFEVEEGDGIRKSGTITRTKTITRTIVSKGGESYKITSSDFNNTKDQQLGSESELLSSSISSEGESTETPEISNFTEHASSVNIVNENPSEIVETFEEDNDGIRKTGTITRTITRTVISKGKQSYTTTSQDMNNMIGELVRTPEIDNLTESVTSLKVARENTPEVVKTFEVEDDESNNKSGSIRTTIIRTTVSEGGQIYTTTSQDIDDINGELVKTPEMSNLMESTTLAEDSEGTRTSGTVTRVITRTIISEGGQSYTTTSQDIDDISGELVKSPEISNLTESKTSVKVTSENLPSEVVETFEAEDAEGTRISGTVTKTIKRTIVSEGGQRYTTTSQDIDDINGELVKTPEISNLAESTTSVKVTTENLPSEVVETFAVENGEGNIKSGTITRTVTSTTVSKGGQSYTTTTKDADNINVELENTPEISNFAAFTAGIKVTSENPLSEVVETFEGEDGQGIRKSTTVRRTVTRTTVSKGGQSYISTSQGANDIKVDLAKTPEISNFTESGTIVKVTNENPSSEVVETFEVEDGEGNKKSGTITRTITRTVSKSGQSNLIPTDIIEKINDPQALVNGSTSRTVTTIRKQVISKEGQQGNSQIEVFVDAFCDDVQLEQEQPQIINKKHSLTVPDLKFNNINVSQEIPPSQLVSSRDDEDSSVFDENAITGTIQGSRISNATGTMKLIKTKIRKTSSVSLNESQEDIIDQILSDDDDIEHLEEDFEKLVKENMN